MKEKQLTEYGNRSHRTALGFSVRKTPRSPNETYREIRKQIREVRYEEALRLLEEIEPRLRGHEWNFLNGCALLEKGYLLVIIRLLSRQNFSSYCTMSKISGSMMASWLFLT